MIGVHDEKKNTICLVLAALLALMTTTITHAQTTDLQTDFTYQGFLSNTNGAVNASCNFQFSLFDAAVNGNQIGTTQQVSGVTVANGAFSVQLDFGAGVFSGQDRFLEIAVQCANDISFTKLIPRQSVTPAPYAGYALSVPWTGITNVPTGFADGVDNMGWSLTGNAGTLPGTNFLGTTDKAAFEFFVNNMRALRIEPAEDDTYFGNNILGGYSGNTIADGVVGATLLGGGQSPDGTIMYSNNVGGGDFGTISGGGSNTVNDAFATVGGGRQNTASGLVSTIGGGFTNIASGLAATISGGRINSAINTAATVGGGSENTASGQYATVGVVDSTLTVAYEQR